MEVSVNLRPWIYDAGDDGVVEGNVGCVELDRAVVEGGR